MEKVEKLFTEAMALGDIQVNGDRAWDFQVKNPAIWQRMLRDGSMGVGEGYVEGWWDVESLDEFLFRIRKYKVLDALSDVFGGSWQNRLYVLQSKMLNLQDKEKSKRVAKEHYDIGNDLYTRMLDPYMQYTCAYWKNAENLNQAQENKLDLICRKLKLEKGMRVLDIGCGWGGLLKFAAEKYGIIGVGVTLSKEQQKWGQESVKDLPVEILLTDYRDYSATPFDRVVSIGILEHVGYKNHQDFMQIVSNHLKDDGLALLHTIGDSVSTTTTEPWIDKYIFPGGQVPSLQQLSSSWESILTIQDLHNIGLDYDSTLMAWYENFKQSWPEIKDKYGEDFYRLWEYYLLSCAGSFRAGYLQLWQMVFTKQYNRLDRYEAER
ncbi:MAG: cyclopropane fatty acyl phospholipid synthase [Minisyncoccia bacterium]